MSITIRTPSDGDFFSWLDLYEGYANFYSEPLTDRRALQLWSWLSDPAEAVNVFVAVDDGVLVGLIHFREFTRPLEAERGVYIDDLFVLEGSRNRGVGRALIDAVSERARESRAGVVQWITAEDNAEAQKFYDGVGKRTSWVTYEIDLSH